ncbi:MAG: hypothetical protein A2X86_21525 [Bdellovibrionales bacterium GWA2_49_15]|nr:MAG: hypothetical protein A2X86_21525 [Bdellovibrionales bacterium GWA2_49_15]HAZ14961.1 hypothetical protein [Bdellovibrionales bacterium]
MKREDINQLLQRLNEKLSDEGVTRELVVCGGAALLLSNYEREETMDVDMLRPDKDEVLQRLSKLVAEETGIARPDWLNSHSSVFFRENPLPKGWEGRLRSGFRASHLEVKVLAPKDILFTKICAHIDREMDEQDIKVLAPTKEIFEEAVLQVTRLPQYRSEMTTVSLDVLRLKLGFADDE